MKASEVLDSAANILLRDGWNQGAFYVTPKYDPEVEYSVNEAYDNKAARTAPCCQDGATARAAYGTSWPMDTCNYADDLVEARRKATAFMNAYVKGVHGFASAIEWNDLPTTTKEDVVAALRGAADNAREAGE